MLAIQQYLRENKTEINGTSFNEMRAYFSKRGVRTSFDPDEQHRRVIFSNKHVDDPEHKRENKYSAEANGLILDAADHWNVLCIPPHTLSPNINDKVVNRFLHKGLYHLYRACDGTLINIYYYRGSWFISTANGYEMNMSCWNGSSYEDILTEILRKYDYANFDNFCATLREDICYSFVITHPKFHPFAAARSSGTSLRIEFVQAVILDTSSSHYLWTDNDFAPKNIPQQEVLPNNSFADIADMRATAEKALDNYIASRETAELTVVVDDKLYNSAPAARCNASPCFGFILRSVNPQETGQYSNLYIESSLMRRIRQVWYEKKILTFCKEHNLNKTNAIVLMCYLNDDYFRHFTILFPQHAALFDQIGEKVQEIVNNIFTNNITARPEETYNALRVHVDAKLQIRINKSSDEYKRLLHSFIVNFANFFLLYQIIF
jgi:hypothetical protein